MMTTPSKPLTCPTFTTKPQIDFLISLSGILFRPPAVMPRSVYSDTRTKAGRHNGQAESEAQVDIQEFIDKTVVLSCVCSSQFGHLHTTIEGILKRDGINFHVQANKNFSNVTFQAKCVTHHEENIFDLRL